MALMECKSCGHAFATKSLHTKYCPSCIDAVLKAYGEGISAREIGEAHDMTRNQVISYANRHNVKHPGGYERRTNWEAHKRELEKQAAVDEREAEEARCSEIPSRHQCKYPHGDPGDEDFSYCGQKTWNGHSYCAKHYSICYHPPKSKTRTPRPEYYIPRGGTVRNPMTIR